MKPQYQFLMEHPYFKKKTVISNSFHTYTLQYETDNTRYELDIPKNIKGYTHYRVFKNDSNYNEPMTLEHLPEWFRELYIKAENIEERLFKIRKELSNSGGGYE